MEIDQLKNLLNEFGSNVKFEHDLKKKNWFSVELSEFGAFKTNRQSIL